MNSTKKDVGLAAILIQLNGRNGMVSSAINARIVEFSLRLSSPSVSKSNGISISEIKARFF